MATLNGGLLALTIPLIVYLGAGSLYRPAKVTRRLSVERVSAGEPVVVTLTLTNEGGRLDEARLEDLPPGHLHLVDGQTCWRRWPPARRSH